MKIAVFWNVMTIEHSSIDLPGFGEICYLHFKSSSRLTMDIFFFSFGVLQLTLPEAPQPYGLLYYPRIGFSNFLHQFHATTPHKQRNLEL
jgi:hypothetical protein